MPPRIVLYRLYVLEKRSMKEIGRLLDRSPTTVCKWLHRYEIPTRPSNPTFNFKKIDGVRHKICKGPLHRDGIWVPVKDFHRRGKDMKPRSWCKACEDVRVNSEPLVLLTDQYLGWLTGCTNSIGIAETARRLGISQEALWMIRNGKRRKLKRSTARAIVSLRTTLNETHEVRNRKSILYGATLRGKPEKPVVYRNDLYRKDGDVHTEWKRQKRAA